MAVPATGLFDMRAVWGSAANDVWAVNSYGDVYRYNGAQWSLATSVGNPLYAVNGSSATNVFFSGANGVVLQLGAGVLTPAARLWRRLHRPRVTGPNPRVGRRPLQHQRVERR